MGEETLTISTPYLTSRRTADPLPTPPVAGSEVKFELMIVRIAHLKSELPQCGVRGLIFSLIL
jgi:hypothetical protein